MKNYITIIILMIITLIIYLTLANIVITSGKKIHTNYTSNLETMLNRGLDI